MCPEVLHQQSCRDSERLYRSSWHVGRKHGTTMGSVFHRRKATACLGEVLVAGRLRHSPPLAMDATELPPARGWTPDTADTERQDKTPSSSLPALAVPGLEKTLDGKKHLKLSPSAPNSLRRQRCGIYAANALLHAFTLN